MPSSPCSRPAPVSQADKVTRSALKLRFLNFASLQEPVFARLGIASKNERGPVGEPVAGDTMSGNVDDLKIGQRFRLETSLACFLAEKQSASMREHLTGLENFVASLGDILKSGTGKVEGIGGAWRRWRIAPVVCGRHRRLQGVLDIADPEEGQGWLVSGPSRLFVWTSSVLPGNADNETGGGRRKHPADRPYSAARRSAR